MDDNKKELIVFLKELTTSLETDNIHPKQLKSLEEFHKMHSFLKESIKLKLDTVTDDMKFEDEAKDFAKFLILAWFMYCTLNKKC